jgi:hypothetical protein
MDSADGSGCDRVQADQCPGRDDNLTAVLLRQSNEIIMLKESACTEDNGFFSGPHDRLHNGAKMLAGRALDDDVGNFRKPLQRQDGRPAPQPIQPRAVLVDGPDRYGGEGETVDPAIEFLRNSGSDCSQAGYPNAQRLMLFCGQLALFPSRAGLSGE